MTAEQKPRCWPIALMGVTGLVAGVLGSLVGGYSASLRQRSRKASGRMHAALAASVVSIPAATFSDVISEFCSMPSECTGDVGPCLRPAILAFD